MTRSDEHYTLFALEESINGHITVSVFSALLRNYIKLYRHPDGLYRGMGENIERFAEYFSVDCREIRAIIDEGSQATDRILAIFGLASFVIEKKCPDCGACAFELVYKSSTSG